MIEVMFELMLSSHLFIINVDYYFVWLFFMLLIRIHVICTSTLLSITFS